MYKVGSVVVVGQLLVNALYSSVCLYISHHNYPGGQGMLELHRMLPPTAGKEFLHCSLIFSLYVQAIES